jgi:GxxExxY protein
MEQDLRYKDITEKIIGASFEVHKFLGNGFPEVIYQRALAYELTKFGLNYKREIEQQVFFNICPNQLEQEEQILWWKEKF